MRRPRPRPTRHARAPTRSTRWANTRHIHYHTHALLPPATRRLLDSPKNYSHGRGVLANEGARVCHPPTRSKERAYRADPPELLREPAMGHGVRNVDATRPPGPSSRGIPVPAWSALGRAGTQRLLSPPTPRPLPPRIDEGGARSGKPHARSGPTLSAHSTREQGSRRLRHDSRSCQV